jgi:asparagine synthase (glutamine-hydrolysing)
MCGIAVIAGWQGAVEELRARIARMNAAQRHRGPDGEGVWIDAEFGVGLGHRRLSILDLSEAGKQPMVSPDGRYVITFNGEIYNYRELREEVGEWSYRGHSDTEVLLAAWAKWGVGALEKLVGMFAFAIWDRVERRLWAVRDRFGVKPLCWARLGGGAVALASEARGIFEAGHERALDEISWATVLARGKSDGWERTFWKGVEQVPAGSALEWDGGAVRVFRWYDFAARVRDCDLRDTKEAAEEYKSLLKESVALRFRADVPVGVNLSGGLDSSVLAAVLREVEEARGGVRAFTFTTGDAAYDELPWVRAMLERTGHELVETRLRPEEALGLAEEVFEAAEGPYGGLPTVAYSKLFRSARELGTYVLLDGQGMDEQWAGYDYYRRAGGVSEAPTVQGSKDRAVRPECLKPDFAALAVEEEVDPGVNGALRRLQYRDAFCMKLPRALRYNDRVSMMWSCELREPFLDHRLFELAFRQPDDRKIRDGQGKWLLRQMAAKLTPERVREALKRPMQTPQREWLRGPLREWAGAWIRESWKLGWFDEGKVEKEWERFLAGESDNSAYVWQWICAGMAAREVGVKA